MVDNNGVKWRIFDAASYGYFGGGAFDMGNLFYFSKKENNLETLGDFLGGYGDNVFSFDS
jgi:hypothetical protein